METEVSALKISRGVFGESNAKTECLFESNA